MRGRLGSAAGVLRAALGLGLLAWVLVRLDPGAAGVARMGRWVALFAVFPLVGACVEAMRLRLLFRAQDLRLPFWLAVRLVLIAFAFNLCIPGGTGGDVLKLYYLASANPGRRVELGTLVLLDRGLAMLAMLLAAALAVAVAGGSTGHLPVVRALGLASLAGAAIASLTLAVGVVAGSRIASRLESRGRLGALAARLVAVVGRYRGRSGALAGAVGITLGGLVVLLGMHAAAANGLLGVRDAPTSAALASLGMIANALPLTPGGLGVGEAAFEQLFALIGASGGAMLALAWRVGALPACALGFVFYGIGMHAEERALATVDPGERAGKG